MQTTSIFGIEVSDFSLEEATATLLRRIDTRQATKLAFLNAHGANLAWEDASYRDIFSDFLTVPDGIGVDIAAKLLVGRKFKTNLNGTDFIPHLLRSIHHPIRVGLVGGKPGIAAAAAKTLSNVASQHTFPVIQQGYMTAAELAELKAKMKQEPVDLLLVGMGNPIQERWIHQQIDGSHATIAAGIGGLFDFLSGNSKRAPGWMRAARIEWLYRLIQEPKRLFKRYIIGNPLFIQRVIRAKLTHKTFS